MKTIITSELCSELLENQTPIASIGSGKAIVIQQLMEADAVETEKEDENGR